MKAKRGRAVRARSGRGVGRAILVGPLAGSDRGFRRRLRELRPGARDFLIGVDGGVSAILGAGLKPSLAVGDWDSLRDRRMLNGIPHVSLKTDKDRSDFHYALRAALGAGTKEIVCLGLTGGRPDHHLAVLLEMAWAARRGGGRVRAIGPEARYELVTARSPWQERLPAGQVVSVLPLTGIARGVSIRGMQFLLSNGTLTPSSHGLSNAAVGGICRVGLSSGTLVVIISL